MINSKRKGATGEREIAARLREYGYNTRRGQQFSGADGTADVEGLPGIHLEIKRVQKLNLEQALQQSERDAYADSIKHGHEMIPVVMHRANREEWKVTMRLDKWMEIYREWEAGQSFLSEGFDG